MEKAFKSYKTGWDNTPSPMEKAFEEFFFSLHR